MDDGRSVLIPSFLFLFCPCPIRFAFGMPVSSASGSSASFRAFPACFRAFPASFRASRLCFRIFVFGFGLFLSVFGFAVFLSGFFDATLRLPVPPTRSPASASCRPFLPPGLPFYLFAALSVRNRRWILPMRHSSEDCPAMSVQHVDTYCICSCIAAVWSGSVSGCAGCLMLPNC